MSTQIVNFRPSGDNTWTEWAQCARPDAAPMFPHEQDTAGIQAAKATCAVCPVRAECLTEAFTRGEQHGIWGGLTTDERNTFRRQTVRRARTAGEPRYTPETLADVALASRLDDELAATQPVDAEGPELDAAAEDVIPSQPVRETLAVAA